MPRDPETDRQYAYFRVTGSGPSSRITKILGMDPDQEWSEGDEWSGKGPHRKRHFTSWVRNSGQPDTAELNTHVRAIINQFRLNGDAVRRLHSDYEVKVVMVSHSQQSFSFELDFDCQRDLTQLGVATWIDAYPSEDVHKLTYDLLSRLGRDALNPSAT